ncbi:MAG: hypothetical protein WA885_22270 [Phormidesmis sp.]
MVLTILSLIVGYLTLSISTALLYATWLSGMGSEMTTGLLAFATLCSLGFATLSGWLTALVARKAPVAHAIALSLMLTSIWGLYLFASKPQGSQEPLSLSLINLAVGIIGVMAGGWLRRRQLEVKAQALSPK